MGKNNENTKKAWRDFYVFCDSNSRHLKTADELNIYS